MRRIAGRTACACIVCLTFLVDVAYAWWSFPRMAVGSSTHLKLSKKSFALVNKSAYPDLERFMYLGLVNGGGIIPWTSGTTDDDNAHGRIRHTPDGEEILRSDAGKFDGGPINTWWGLDHDFSCDGVLAQYRLFNYENEPFSTYYYMALMAHLIADQGVPAHAANISHLKPLREIVTDRDAYGDNLENAAYSQTPGACKGCHTSVPTIVLIGADPRDYYHKTEGLLDVTKGNLPSWKRPGSSLVYWIASPSYIGQPFYQAWGTYGYAGLDGYDYKQDGQDIISTQFMRSTAFVSGFLQAASKKLPPLVRDLDILPVGSSPAIIDMVNGTDIVFRILENRSPTVRVTIKANNVAYPSNFYYVRANGKVWNNVQQPLSSASGDNDLPYEELISLDNWKGEVAGGITLPNGVYAMRIEVKDPDGNEVNQTYTYTNDSGFTINELNSDTEPANDTEHGFIILTAIPEAPAGLSARTDNAEVLLTWARPTKNTDGTNLTDLKNYVVSYSTTMCNDPGAQVIDPVVPSGTALESYLFDYLENGTTYFFAVRARDKSGNGSDNSTCVSAKPVDAIWVHAPDSISDALESAGYGDLVMVGPGTYYETGLTIGDSGLSMHPANIELRSERGPDETIIDATGNSGGATLRVGDSSKVIGFTIRDDAQGIECLFDDDVLVANNIFIANDIGISVAGVGYSSGDPVRIYNNVFDANVTGINTSTNYSTEGLVDIRNNIFRKGTSGTTGINVLWSAGVCIYDNDFWGFSAAARITYTGYAPSVGTVYTCDPLFVDGHHLGSACGVDQGTSSLFYDGAYWEDCIDVAANHKRADLGAYGGPSAYVDKNLNGIPDCDETVGYPASITVLKNSVEQAITLAARPQPGLKSAETALASYTVVTPPSHGSLSGTAPDLYYTVHPDFVGEDGFTFAVGSQFGESAPIPVSIMVKSSDHPPVAVGRTIHVNPNQTTEIVLDGSDEDGDGLTFALDTPPASGSLACSHGPECYFSPAPDMRGTVSFSYHVSDGITDSHPAWMTIVVGSPPATR